MVKTFVKLGISFTCNGDMETVSNMISEYDVDFKRIKETLEKIGIEIKVVHEVETEYEEIDEDIA